MAKITYNTECDWEGTPWFEKEFQFPERTIRIATSFSGIGAAEYALKKLGLKHKIVFACDNGERYLMFGYKKLAELAVAAGLDNTSKEEYAEQILNTNKSKNKSLTFETIYNNLFVELKDKKTVLELPTECIDILTKGFSNEEVVSYVNKLYEQTGKKNKVKESYMANYSLEEKNWHNDIRFLDASLYKDQIDIYAGGAPCQSYSLSGRRLCLKDTRGTLFYDFAKVIKECRPKVFIYENVKGMTCKKGEKSGWEVAKEVFESLGYDIHFRVLNAADYGSVQARERLFCIGFLKPTDFTFPQPFKPQKEVQDILDEDNQTIHHFNARDCLRYMGFDDDFKQVVANTTMMHQCGNSIVVDVLMALYRQMDITQYGVDMNGYF